MAKRLTIGGVTVPQRMQVDKATVEFLRPILGLRKKWNDSDIAKAVNLAQCQYDIVRITAELRAEGDVIENKRGTPIPNPKYQILERLTQRELALSRAIHVHAEATMGRSRDSLGAKAVKQMAAEEAARKFAPMPPPQLKAVK